MGHPPVCILLAMCKITKYRIAKKQQQNHKAPNFTIFNSKIAKTTTFSRISPNSPLAYQALLYILLRISFCGVGWRERGG